MAETPAQRAAATLATERAIDDLRRQIGVFITQEKGLLAALPLEFCDEPLLAELARGANPRLIITSARARQLGLAPADTLPENMLAIDIKGLSLSQLLVIADPLTQAPPATSIAIAPAKESESLAVLLAKQAALLPTMLVASFDGAPAALAHWQALDLCALKLSLRHPLIEVLPIADAKLPVHGAENATLRSFRSRYGSSVHLALIVGDIAGEPAPLVRVHSSCVTGDILGSLRCDCGDQLRLALETICAEGKGVLIYLHQEGRGIGIGNKLRAYHLQECGMDTYDANLALGFEEDERDFAIAAAILAQLGISRIRLLTNNPSKITALKGNGIVIEGRVPVAAPSGKHNHDYLKAKAEKTGHLL